MDAPFIFSKPVSGRNFICRKADCDRLAGAITEGRSVVLIEAPRSGKTSLLRQTLQNMLSRRMRVSSTEVSLLNIRSLEALCAALAGSLLRSIATTPSEFEDAGRRLLTGTHLRFDPEAYSARDAVVVPDGEVTVEDLVAVLSIPGKITAQGESRVVIIREFQNILLLDGADAVMKAVSEAVSRRGRASFVLSG